jgi:hypothetical protein
MEKFMWVFGIVLFIVSCFLLYFCFYVLFDANAKQKEKEVMELQERAEFADRLQTNLILDALNSNVVSIGKTLISLLGIFFGSVIIYLYK